MSRCTLFIMLCDFFFFFQIFILVFVYFYTIIYYTPRCNDDESIAWTVNTRTSAQDIIIQVLLSIYVCVLCG